MLGYSKTRALEFIGEPNPAVILKEAKREKEGEERTSQITNEYSYSQTKIPLIEPSAGFQVVHDQQGALSWD